MMAPVTVDALTGSESMIEVLKVNYNLLLLIFFSFRETMVDTTVINELL